ncbi:major histocompatibility complex class I-related gene protein-like isoform X3 [Acanthopagrus latus]|uniref:major histocompatibility complex class I-related gene protein-like isoform X3 n=1 Tax=Acanthopagrus latus TaxID=8177 RepID=UPI00187BC7A6|nr:major histocompatibility complex class I-related gene protein-like isoform X3 [Acanthopagrus latus]
MASRFIAVTVTLHRLLLHSLKHFITASTGIPNIPEVVGTVEIDELLVGSCDSKKRMEVKHDIAESFLMKYPEQLEWYKQECLGVFPIFKPRTHSLMRLYNQTGGVHVLQKVEGCEWDDETEEVKGFSQFGFDGEDLLKLDPKTFTWIALRPEAVNISMMWYTDTYLRGSFKTVLTQIFPELLKQFVEYGRSVLLRTELPSVSLLQKTPSSPVSCLATGFYPHRASLVWRKDGEELHEEVDHGEILPNHDGTFQMSVDLNLSSVTPEDWTRYDCVFQFSGVKEEIITRLEKDRIRTNWVKPSNMTVPVTAAVVVLALILIGAAGFIVYKKKKAISPPSAPDNSTELSEQLNPET